MTGIRTADIAKSPVVKELSRKRCPLLRTGRSAAVPQRVAEVDQGRIGTQCITEALDQLKCELHQVKRATKGDSVTLPGRPYIVQVRLGPQSIVIGVVQPDAAVAVQARRSARTSLYFRPDIATPSAEIPDVLCPNAR